MTDQPRAIIHLDLDAFYASVEVLENPELEGKPVVVGGRPDQRGVVAAASYPAREYGIRSTMPMSRALVLCPELVVVPHHFDLYRRYSRQVMDILHETSDLVEQISIDEAYLDVSDQSAGWDDAARLAGQLQQRVQGETRLSASLGVATNKLVAKVASDRDKPGGLTVVAPGKESAFLAPLPVRVLWGVGPVTAQKLAEAGVHSVGDLAKMPETELRAQFGSHGAGMARRAQGIDSRPIVTEYERKSIGHERTFRSDLADLNGLKQELWKMSQSVSRRLRRAELTTGTVAIKLRYSDFTTLSRQTTLAVPTDDDKEIYRAALTLLERTWQPGRRVRLLGVTGRNLAPPAGQLTLW